MNKTVNTTGIKIVDDNRNKRISDIFNTKSNTIYDNSAMNKMNKTRMIEVTEEIIDNKMRSRSPYFNGQKNMDYVPHNFNSSLDMGINPDKNINLSRSGMFGMNHSKSTNKTLIENEKEQEKVEVKKENRLAKSSSDVNAKLNKRKNKILEETQEIKVERDTSNPILLDQNERSKNFLEKKKQQKLKHQEELIQSATLSLLSSRNNQNNHLYQQFQNSKGFFDEELRKDHAKERAKERFIKNQNVQSSVSTRKSKLIREQRHEIIDYYEMNQKLIDKSNISVGDEQNIKYFNQVKKVNESLVRQLKLKKEEGKKNDNQENLEKSKKSKKSKSPSQKTIGTKIRPKSVNVSTPKKPLNNVNKADKSAKITKIPIKKK